MRPYLFTSESVSEGHPDKLADQISDAILDAYLSQDPLSRVACETLLKDNLVVLAGEISSKAHVNHAKIAHDVLAQAGYDDPDFSLNLDQLEFKVCINEQSFEIAQGVFKESSENPGAGDQGIMFGYACDETSNYMPLPFTLANQVIETLTKARKSKALPFLGPDAKSQVTLKYSPDHECLGIHSVVVSTQHRPNTDLTVLRKEVEKLIKNALPQELLSTHTTFHINPSGSFVKGGPVADCGLTGRKIIVDSYGGSARHGGGAFSGKDPSKVDRSAAYMARFLAKNIIAAKLAKRCEIQLSYVIGQHQPSSIKVESFQTSTLPESILETVLMDNFDLSPRGIISFLQLQRPIFLKTSTGGHFGRNDPDFLWEKIDLAAKLQQEAKKMEVSNP